MALLLLRRRFNEGLASLEGHVEKLRGKEDFVVLGLCQLVFSFSYINCVQKGTFSHLKTSLTLQRLELNSSEQLLGRLT